MSRSVFFSKKSGVVPEGNMVYSCREPPANFLISAQFSGLILGNPLALSHASIFRRPASSPRAAMAMIPRSA